MLKHAMVNKAALRKTMRARRNALSALEAATASAAIHRILERSEVFAGARVLLSYVEKGNEIQTRPLIERALRGGREIFVPIVDEDNRMQWSRLCAMSDLAAGRFGVQEPRLDRREISVPHDGVVLVPGLAFTRDGDRLGYGGGHFDRFLSEWRGVSIGLAYDWQVVEELPTEHHDARVAFVVTPQSPTFQLR